MLLLQLAYKCIWLTAVALPLAVRGTFPAHGRVFVIIFATFIIGDLIAVPFRTLFATERTGERHPGD